jgi:AcrR family transcriptional regulator
MARPRSEDKRNAILDAAIRLIAERGLASTPTSAISKAAEVAEGTLFTYFRTKGELVNALYLELKREMASVLINNLPRHEDVRGQLQFLWNAYLDWGMGNRHKRRAMEQLHVSSQVTPEVRAVASAPFAEIEKLITDNIARKVLRDYPVAYLGASMSAMAEMTIGFMQQDPTSAERYRQSGFEMLWNGMAYRDDS